MIKKEVKLDLEILDNKIKKELGIDIKKYRNEEVVQNFVDLLIFPTYAIKWMLSPVLIAIILFFLGYFYLNLVHIEFIFYSLIGFALFIVLGLFFGLNVLMWKIKSDILGVMNYSLNILNTAVTDIKKVNRQVKNENKKEVLGLLFKGIIHIVTIPMITKTVTNKIPFFGGLVNILIKKILIRFSKKINFDEDNLNVKNKEQTESNILLNYSKTISMISSGLDKTMHYIFSITQFPFKLGLGITLFILTIFIWLID